MRTICHGLCCGRRLWRLITLAICLTAWPLSLRTQADVHFRLSCIWLAHDTCCSGLAADEAQFAGTMCCQSARGDWRCPKAVPHELQTPQLNGAAGRKGKGGQRTLHTRRVQGHSDRGRNEACLGSLPPLGVLGGCLRLGRGRARDERPGSQRKYCLLLEYRFVLGFLETGEEVPDHKQLKWAIQPPAPVVRVGADAAPRVVGVARHAERGGRRCCRA